VGQVHRAAGEGDGHVGHQVDRRGAGRQRQGDEHVVRSLEREQAGDAGGGQLLGPGGGLGRRRLELDVDRQRHRRSMARV
jgi:hypothetical protein